MNSDISSSLSEDAKEILDRHLNVGPEKPISYLPIRTVEKIIGMTVNDYASLVDRRGNRTAVFTPEQCCIKSGAVYSYSERDLNDILVEHVDLLSMHQWPTIPSDFIKRLSSDWLDRDHPIMPVVRKAFGER